VLATTDPKTFKTILADTFEALLGAITLDTQASAASSLFRKKLGVVVESILANPPINWKSRLQECVQYKGCLPKYKISEQSGSFKATVYYEYGGWSIEACAKAKTRKEAKQSAAKNALVQIKARAIEAWRPSRVLRLCPEEEKTVAIAKMVICDTHMHDEQRGRWQKCVIALNDGRMWTQFLPGEDVLAFCMQLPDWRIVVNTNTFAFMVISIIPTRDPNQLREDGPKLLQDYANEAWPLDTPEDGSLASDLPPETPEDGSLASDMPPETPEDGSLASDLPPETPEDGSDHESQNCLIA
ncbi:MAG TPA: putative dsRNA-binding protein, partial [Chlamydiales bacterium]|nr:putative dsRNA-binding protein [Chlamydiales bacterium]